MLNPIHNLKPTRKSPALPWRLHLFAALVALGSFVPQSYAQATTGLRNPYIPCALVTPPDQAPAPGQAPPIGDGPTPVGVPAGDTGTPFAPPTEVTIPPVSPLDRDTVNAAVAPYWKPSAQNNPVDPGLLPGTTSGFKPPAVVVNINPKGGMPGDDAPRTRWAAQTSRDLGYPRTKGSPLTDYGQKLEQVAVSGVVPQISQDGPRPFIFPAPIGATTNRDPNLPSAQVTQDLHGNRQLFKGPTLRARMTVADY